MFLEKLDQLRHKSKEARKRYALMYSVGITACIVAVWLTVLFAGKVPHAEPEYTETTTSPFGQGLFDITTESFDNNNNMMFVDTRATATPPTYSTSSHATTTGDGSAQQQTASTTDTGEVALAEKNTTASSTHATSTGDASADSGGAGFIDGILRSDQ